MKKARAVVITSLIFTLLAPAIARAEAPSFLSSALWQAYQEVAIEPAASFPYQSIPNTAVDQSPRNDKWFAAPNVIVTGSPSSQDMQNLKDFTSTVAQSCTGMTPTYQTQVQTTVTTASRGRVSTRTITTPNTYLMNFYYVPTSAFVKVSSSLTTVAATATDSAVFTYDSAGNIYGTKTFLSTDQATQAQRDIAMKRHLLQALGLFNLTSNPAANAFSSSNSAWDGTLSDFDRELITLHCSVAMPSYKTAPEIASSITRVISAGSTLAPTDSYNVLGSATETSGSFVISTPSIDRQISQGVAQLAYSIVSDSGSTLDSGILEVGSDPFRGSWTLSYSNLNPYTTYTITVTPSNAIGSGATTSYDLFTWNYGNL